MIFSQMCCRLYIINSLLFYIRNEYFKNVQKFSENSVKQQQESKQEYKQSQGINGK